MNVAQHDPPDILFPLSRFYSSQNLAVPVLTQLAGPQVPEPYRGLLVHSRDMTPTLEAFFSEEILLEVLHSQTNGEVYSREVVLSTALSRKPVEYGSIDIQIANFDPEPRERILKNDLPLGTILGKFQVRHLSAPRAFFSLHSDALMGRHLAAPRPSILYGRRNRLLTLDGKTLADIVEIIAPIDPA